MHYDLGYMSVVDLSRSELVEGTIKAEIYREILKNNLVTGAGHKFYI